MQLVVLALLGCCVVAHSASLSDTLGVERAEDKSSLDPSIELSENPEDFTKREKRSGLGGSGGFFSGIGSAILGKVAQASKGVSTGSIDGSSGRGEHEYETVEYGPPVHPHDESNFDIWSFKKAILNTLFQALKAIGGGVIALKGKLIKGGGIVVSAKGNIISAKGEAITHLGRQIAASAILTPPKAMHSYAYEAPAVHVSSGHDHDNSYGGPPPSIYSPHGGYAATGSADSYGHSGYAAPSDDADHPGLVILKSLKGDESHETSSYKNKLPGVAAAIVESIGNKKKEALQSLVSKITGVINSKGVKNSMIENHVSTNGELTTYDVSDSHDYVEHKELSHQPSQSYGPPSGGFENSGDGGTGHGGNQESHVIHNEENSVGQILLDGEKLSSSLGSIPFNQHNQGLYQQYHQQNQQNQHQHFSIGNDNHLSQNNYAAIGHGQLMFAMPVELPILQSYNQQMYLPPVHGQIRDYNIAHNLYNGAALKRNSRAGIPTSFKILPAIGYTIKDQRVYRI